MKLHKFLIAITISLCSGYVYANLIFDKPINLVVSFPPGGDTDVIARVIADKLSKKINQNVLVQNRSGASGVIGNRYVADSKADGQTLLLTPSTIVTSKLLMGDKITYDLFKDFTPIIEVVSNTPLFIVVNSSTNIKSHKDLVDAIKQGRVRTYATPGSGSPMNMVGEYYKKEIGLDITQVPYRGNAPAITALLTNEVDIMITGLFPILPHLETKKVTIIAVASDKRSVFAPNVPTLFELGLSKADFSGWFALLGPAGMDSKTVDVINQLLNEILKDPEVIGRINNFAYTVGGGTSKDMERSLKHLYNKFDQNIKKFAIKVNVE